MSMELGQNRKPDPGISSWRSMPSMKQFLNICEYLKYAASIFDAQENKPSAYQEGFGRNEKDVR